MAKKRSKKNVRKNDETFVRRCKACGKKFETDQENYYYCSWDCRKDTQDKQTRRKKSGNIRGEERDNRVNRNKAKKEFYRSNRPAGHSRRRLEDENEDDDEPIEKERRRKPKQEKKLVKPTSSHVITLQIQVDEAWFVENVLNPAIEEHGPPEFDVQEKPNRASIELKKLKVRIEELEFELTELQKLVVARTSKNKVAEVEEDEVEEKEETTEELEDDDDELEDVEVAEEDEDNEEEEEEEESEDDDEDNEDDEFEDSDEKDDEKIF